MNSIEMNEKEQAIALLEDAYKARINNLSESLTLAQKALSISRAIDDKALIGKSLNQLALYYMIIGNFERSTKKSEEAIACFEALEDEKGIADAKYTIAGVFYKTNNYHLGLVYFTDALKIYQKNYDYYNQSRVEKSLGTIYEFIDDQNNAFKSYKSAIRNAKRAGDVNLESNVYNNLSGLLLKYNKAKLAMELIEYSIGSKKETKDIRGYAYAIYGRGKVYANIGEYHKAELDYLAAIETHTTMGETLGLTMSYNKLGELYLKMNLHDKAYNAAYEGLILSSKYNTSLFKIKSLELLYKICKVKNETEKAYDFYEKYLYEREKLINTQSQKIVENYDVIIKMKTLQKEAELQKEKQKVIEKKNRDEEESVKLKQEFLSIMSHEIRTPLNAITTIVSMLNDKVDEENKQLLQSIQFASNNLIHIVNDVLDFTKLDSNKAKLELRSTNFKTLSNNIFNIYQGLASQKKLQLNFKTDIPEKMNYLIDETKITQILGNLIGNAIKFTEVGKVEVKIKLVKETKKYHTFSVKVTDTGEGIATQDMAQIFDSFSQIKPVLTRKQGGTGLGLAIVKKLVELHKSKIKVKSELGFGSEFYFQLKFEKAPQEIQAVKEDYMGLKGKIALLAEDTPMNALLMKKLLSNWGIITDHVVNGKQALEQVQLKKYDFILMDIHMPEMNGFEATKLIRNNKNLNVFTPIFALTADVTAENDDENATLFNGFLWKPLEIEKLYAALANKVALPEVQSN
jgi:signal transduction histidine kinase/CheY-like chemotaxis protein